MSKVLQEKYDHAMTLFDSLAEDDCPCNTENCVHKEARRMVQIYETERLHELSIQELVCLLVDEALAPQARRIAGLLKTKIEQVISNE